MKKKELAERLGMNVDTLYRWNGYPGYALAYLELYEAHERLKAQVIEDCEGIKRRCK